MSRIIRRRTDGDETWIRLKDWTKGQKAGERLAANILVYEEFKLIDPSHPLGGRDNTKDIICVKNNLKWIGACYFTRSQQTFNNIKKKFENDCKGIEKNKVNGIVFITNQEISLAERNKIILSNKKYKTEIYHLERLVNLLNSPVNYGIRLEYLDIKMTKEEQLSYFAQKDKSFNKIDEKLDNFMADYKSFKEAIFEREYQLIERSEEEIIESIEEFFDKVWYNRHQGLKYRVLKKNEKIDPEIWRGALAAAKKVEKKYGKINLGPWSDFEWGMLNGKLSALRWVLGEDWDMLDT